MSKSEDVVNFRRRIKIALVQAFGDKCAICGQSFEQYVYDFHHINPAQKSFSISGNGITHSKADTAKEAQKCIMVCANCHRIIENTQNNFNFQSNFDEKVFYEQIDLLAGRNKKIREEIDKAFTIPKNSRKPERQVLKQLIKEKPFLQIAAMFGVTDNAIRKWCKSYNLPSRVCDIKNISDSEWEKI